MAYEVVMPYHLHMPSYFLETFTEYPKTKPAYPIVSCRGKVCLPEDTKQTVFGRATSPLRTKRQHYPHFDTLPCFL